MCFEFEASAGHGSTASNSKQVDSGHARPAAVPRSRPARRLLRPHRGDEPASARGRAAAARGRRPQLRAVPAPGPPRRLADGQPPHDRPGRRRRLQPQRPDLPGGPAGEGRPGHAHARPRTTSGASRSRSPTPGARGSRRCSPATSRSSTSCCSSRSRATTSRPWPICWRRCATTCARRRPAPPRPVAAAPTRRCPPSRAAAAGLHAVVGRPRDGPAQPLLPLGVAERRGRGGAGRDGIAELCEVLLKPEGTTVQSSRAWSCAALRNVCGALAGMLAVSPSSKSAAGRSPTRTSTEPSRTRKHSSKSCRCGGGPPPGGISMSIIAKRPAVCSPEAHGVGVGEERPSRVTLAPPARQAPAQRACAAPGRRACAPAGGPPSNPVGNGQDARESRHSGPVRYRLR